jgi:hypothetical protein
MKFVRDIATLLKLPKLMVGDVIVKCKHEGTTTTKTMTRYATFNDR